ncbi:MAG: hypothetical protein O9339_19155 [Rubrivivax sp.]|jgi:hypothetical protein|nr:hypothetical protein [Rubrivivax sp.]
MLLRIATAVGIALALAGVWYALTSRSARSPKPTIAAAVRIGCMALGSTAFLLLASTALLWLFPLNVVASAVVGYASTKSARLAFPVKELKAFAALSLVCGASIAAALATSPDPFMLQVAAPYSLLNAMAFAGASFFTLRHAHGEA